jgi:hypothetical protein
MRYLALACPVLPKPASQSDGKIELFLAETTLIGMANNSIYIFGYDKRGNETLLGTANSPEKAMAFLVNYVAVNRRPRSDSPCRPTR